MTEVAQKVESAPSEKEIGHGHGFEPEILAFCCEH